MSLDAEESFADRVLAAGALQALAGAAARRAAGQGGARHRRGRRHRPRGRRRAVAAPAPAWSASTSTRTARAAAVEELGDAASASAATSPSEDAVARRLRRRRRARSAASTSSSPTPASPRARRSRRRRSAEWERNHAILGTGYFLVSREAFKLLRRAGHRRLDRVRRLQERARGGQERRRLLVGQGGRAAPRALPGRGGRRRRHPRQHGQPRRGPPGLADLGLAAGARSARPPTGSTPDELEEHYRKRTTLGRQHPARGHRRGGHALRVATAGPARAPATCSTSTAGCRRPTHA